jgi:hypothetical protein
MRNLFFSRVYFALIFFAFPLATASFARAEKASSYRHTAFIQEIFEKINSPDQLLKLAAFSGASLFTLRTIDQDIREHSGKSFPQLRLKKNEVVINGRATGLWIDPKAPLRVAYQGVTWKLDEKASFQENYSSFENFLKPKKKARTYWLLPSAQAEWTDRDFSALGGIAAGLGIVGAGIVGVSLGSTAVGTGAVGLALTLPALAALMPALITIGLVVAVDGGAQAGMAIYDNHVLKKALNDVTSADGLIVVCGEKSATLTFSHKPGPSSVLEFARLNTGLQVRLLNDMKEVTSSSGTEFENPIYSQLMSCHNEEQGSALTASLTESIRNLKQVRSESKKDPAQPGVKAEGAI